MRLVACLYRSIQIAVYNSLNFRRNEKSPPFNGEPALVCPEEDSNLHPVKDTALNRARLPVPPSGHRNAAKYRL